MEITGQQGIYSNKIKDKKVAYGRNATYNFVIATKQKPLDMVDFSYRYSPKRNAFKEIIFKLRSIFNKNLKQIETKSLLGASFEEINTAKNAVNNIQEQKPVELSQRTELSVEEENASLKKTFSQEFDTSVVDMNKDGKIDTGEYAASILLSDKLSDGKIDGVINKDGQNQMMAFLIPKNRDVATETFKELYDGYNLEKANQEFLSNPNNTVI